MEDKGTDISVEILIFFGKGQSYSLYEHKYTRSIKNSDTCKTTYLHGMKVLLVRGLKPLNSVKITKEWYFR